MALLKMVNNVFAGNTNVSKYTNLYFIATNNKTMRIRCVMKFWESCYDKVAYNDWLMCAKICY